MGMRPQKTGRIAKASRWLLIASGAAESPDRFWSSGIESMIAGDDEGPCKGIELNIWERAKVTFSCYVLLYYCYKTQYV